VGRFLPIINNKTVEEQLINDNVKDIYNFHSMAVYADLTLVQIRKALNCFLSFFQKLGDDNLCNKNNIIENKTSLLSSLTKHKNMQKALCSFVFLFCYLLLFCIFYVSDMAQLFSTTFI
jgi:hypothetical protein